MKRNKLTECLLVLLLTVAGTWTTPAAGTNEHIVAAIANANRSAADRERDARSRPDVILEFLGVRPGMSVLDVFSGGGYYSELLAYSVGPEGHVVAHNNAAYESFAADQITQRYGGNRLPQVERLSSETDALALGEARFDVIMLVMSYHDIYYEAPEDGWTKVDRDGFFDQLRAALKPGGVLGIVDHVAVRGSGKAPAQDLHRIDPEFAKADIQAAGFVFEAESDVLRNPDDDHTKLVFDKSVRGHTDRFVYRFRKPR